MRRTFGVEISKAQADPALLVPHACLLSLAGPGDRMSIGWSLKKEQAMGAVIGWDMNEHIHRMAGRERTTARTEKHIVGKVDEGSPGEIAWIARPGQDPRMTHIISVRDRAIEMSDKTHGRWLQIEDHWSLRQRLRGYRGQCRCRDRGRCWLEWRSRRGSGRCNSGWLGRQLCGY